eukprot:TRINITY_DN65154_c0_g1_i1.p1 TRINITY_DN65154_c0_g1~~TRINITY_DN65154_c0_g1_i1.p1  ORF type:complete len:322 (-),score=60.81 TRINITY_DN65154_c0_g1_i1:149-1114(-)
MTAYRPGQGLSAGSADKLRDRKDAASYCKYCGERAEEGGLNCASVDDSKQWKGLLGEGTGDRKKARCSECTKPLPDDHDPAMGPFCRACAPSVGQWQAPAPKAAQSKPEKLEVKQEEIQFGHMVQPGVCKRCKEERRQRDREKAKAKKEARDQEREQALEGSLEAPERIEVTLGERPFGMTPSKADNVGYLIAKASDGKPAAKSGVRPGWRVAEVAGQSCQGMGMEEVQALLKAAELPVRVGFDAMPSNGDFCTCCQKVLVWAEFSRKMRTKPADKRRCIACVEAAGGDGEGEAEAGGGGTGRGGAKGRGGGYGGRGAGRG